MTRGISVLGLLQTMLIVVGLLTVRFVLMAWGYPDAIEFRWNPVSVWVREFGLFLLLLPVLWVGFALIAADRRTGGFYPWMAWALGYGLLALLLFLFMYAAVFAFTRKILIVLI